MDLEKDIIENQALFLLISKSKYSSRLSDIMKILDKNFNKICYINLNKSFKKLETYFKKAKLNHDKFYMIGLNKPPNNQELRYYAHIDSADNLGGISIEFSDFVYRGCKIFLFDSFSDMIKKAKKNELLQFVHMIIVKSKMANTKVIFLSSNENIESNVLNELKMVFDKVITDTSR